MSEAKGMALNFLGVSDGEIAPCRNFAAPVSRQGGGVGEIHGESIDDQRH